MKTRQEMRVLCAIDFDVNSLAALDFARDLVCNIEGELYVLHVIPTTAPFVTSAPLVNRTHNFAQIRLNEIARQSLSDIDHQLLVRTGGPAKEIIATATELDTYMVVIATHGCGGLSGLLLGSVAEAVIREAPCPVLIIRGTSRRESAHRVTGETRGSSSSRATSAPRRAGHSQQS
jgi:nucleotide-binding universal stress UspA family protein